MRKRKGWLRMSEEREEKKNEWMNEWMKEKRWTHERHVECFICKDLHSLSSFSTWITWYLHTSFIILSSSSSSFLSSSTPSTPFLNSFFLNTEVTRIITVILFLSLYQFLPFLQYELSDSIVFFCEIPISSSLHPLVCLFSFCMERVIDEVMKGRMNDSRDY